MQNALGIVAAGGALGLLYLQKQQAASTQQEIKCAAVTANSAAIQGTGML